LFPHKIDDLILFLSDILADGVAAG